MEFSFSFEHWKKYSFVLLKTVWVYGNVFSMNNISSQLYIMSSFNQSELFLIWRMYSKS